MSRDNNQEKHNDMFYHSAYWKICEMLTELHDSAPPYNPLLS